MKKLLVPIVLLAVLALVATLPKSVSAQQEDIRLTRTAFGNITWDDFSRSSTGATVWNRAI